MLAIAGLGLFTAALPRYWRLMPARLAMRPCPAMLMRIAGAAALLLSLAMCVAGGSASSGVLIWVVELALAASIVAAASAARSQ